MLVLGSTAMAAPKAQTFASDDKASLLNDEPFEVKATEVHYPHNVVSTTLTPRASMYLKLGERNAVKVPFKYTDAGVPTPFTGGWTQPGTTKGMFVEASTSSDLTI